MNTVNNLEWRNQTSCFNKMKKKKIIYKINNAKLLVYALDYESFHGSIFCCIRNHVDIGILFSGGGVIVDGVIR